MSKPEDWCAVCCTRHADARDCPGNLLATGPERHARKFAVTQDKRLEYYGVLIAESGELWRARIFTYPNMLWSVPGGRGTIKFAGATAAEAEAQAVRFLKEHCEERRYSIAESGEEEAAPGTVEKEDSPEQDPQRGKEERHPCKVPVRFGEERATEPATTANLSTGGVYVATDRPVAKGKRVRMLLDVQAYTIPLVGTVAWVRPTDEPGKPKGMGVQLHAAPALYQRYVEEVQKTMAENAAQAEAGESS